MQDARTGFEKAWLRRDLLQLKVFRKNAVVMDWKLSIAKPQACNSDWEPTRCATASVTSSQEIVTIR